MKITVRDDDTGNTLGAMQVKIKDLGEGLERVAVKAFGLTRPVPPADHLNDGAADRKHFQRTLFARMLNAASNVSWTPLTATPHTSADGVKTIEIKLSLPSWQEIRRKLSKLWRWARALPRKYQIAGVASLILLGFGLHYLFATSLGPPPKPVAATPAKALTLTRGTPKFNTVLPAGKSINSLGGWVRVSPPDHNAVYAYIDHIHDVQVSVSEQPLPKNFQADTANKITELADNFNATEKVTAADGTQVHIGTSGTGPQSVILTKNKLLILIKSTAPLTNNQWVTYVSSLK
ncbi:MAG TPA: hypothetical protein VFL85_03260 [Candidatus Saccharimonadales bacterium]|nr:hypothetical protein [Candidatus Saccharimonadales bacterium]